MNRQATLFTLIFTLLPMPAHPWFEHANALLTSARVLTHTLTTQQHLSDEQLTPEHKAQREMTLNLLTAVNDLATLVSTCSHDEIIDNAYDLATQCALLASNIGTIIASLDQIFDLELTPDDEKDNLAPSALETTLKHDALAQTMYLYILPALELVGTLTQLYVHNTTLDAQQQTTVRQCARAWALLSRVAQSMLLKPQYSKEKAALLVLMLGQCMRVTYTCGQVLEQVA